MLQVARWRREQTDRDEIVIVPPEGRAGGHIAIREGVHPLTSLRGAPVAALCELIGDDSGARTMTAEGEFAAVIDEDGGTQAVIWGDVEQTEIRGVAPSPASRGAIAAVVREIVYHLPLGLGSDRTRRYWYRAPIGWRGAARGLVTDWRSSDGNASIKVMPARLVRRPPPAVAIEQFLHDDPFVGFVLAPPITQNSITIGSLHGMRGTAMGRVGDRPRTCITIAIEDRRVMYAARLTCDGPSTAYEPVLEALMASIEPLEPVAAIGGAVAIQSAAHWAD